jgi:WD40 repeat protein
MTNYRRLFLSLPILFSISSFNLAFGDPAKEIPLSSDLGKLSNLQWLAFSPNGTYLGVRFSTDDSKDIIIVMLTKTWAIHKQVKVNTYDINLGIGTICPRDLCAFNSDESTLVVLDGKKIGSLSLKTNSQYLSNDIAFSDPNESAYQLESIYAANDINANYVSYISKNNKLVLAKLSPEYQATSLLVREHELYHDVTSTTLDLKSGKFVIASVSDESYKNKKTFIEVYDITKVTNISRVFSDEGQWSRIATLRVSQDGKILGSGGADGYLTLWTLGDKKPCRRVRLSTHTISTIGFGSSEEIVCGSLASGQRPNGFLYDVKSSKLPIEFSLDSQSVYGVGFTPKGDKIVSVGGDKILRVHGLDTLMDK